MLEHVTCFACCEMCGPFSAHLIAPATLICPRSGWSRLYRQTILLSSFAAPEMNALLGRRCANHAGAARLRPAYPGVLSQVLPQVGC